jgi:hypothetical protein
VWFDGLAGPYKVLVHVEAPPVVPGIAIINIRVGEAGVARVTGVRQPLRRDGRSTATRRGEPDSGKHVMVQDAAMGHERRVEQRYRIGERRAR